MTDQPDFEALRAKRNDEIEAFAAKLRAEGWHVSACLMRSRDACYCACAEGGPCEHEFQGWREFQDEDGCGGGEAFCRRCGLGAMSHSLHTCNE